MKLVSNPDRIRPGIVFNLILFFLFINLFSIVMQAEQKRIISLRDAINIAMKNFPDFKESENSVNLSMIDVKTKKSVFLPDLNAGSTFSYRWGKNLDSGTGSYLASDYSNLDFSLSSTFNIFNGFKDIASLREAELKNRSASENHGRFNLDVIFLTLQRYVNTLIAKEFIDVEKENLEAQKLLLEKIDDFFKAGKKPVTDLYQQKADISRSRLNLMDARQNYISAKLDLNTILGLGNIDDFLLKSPDIPRSDKIDTDALNSRTLKTAFKMRKDLTAKKLDLQASGKSIEVARSGYWPKLSFFANLNSGYSGLDLLYSYSEQLFKNRPSVSAGLTLSIPIFNKNSVRNSVAAAKIQHDNSRLELEKSVRRVTNEVKLAVENYKTAIEQIKAAESQLKYSKAALQSITDRYNVNASTITDLTQARALYKQSGFDLIKAKYNLLTKKAAIYYYSGDKNRLISLLNGEN